VPHVGIHCERFSCIYETVVRCPECKINVNLRSQDYRRGTEENNKDEYYRRDCPKCDYSIVYECNYDDSRYCIAYHNVGESLRTHPTWVNNKFSGEKGILTDEEFSKMVNELEVRKIKSFPKNRAQGKKPLLKHILSEVKLLETTAP